MDRATVPRSATTPLRMLAESDVQRTVADRGGVRRIVASSDAAAVLYASQLHPARLHVSRPNVVLECHNDEWFGLDPARFNVGHGGGGPLTTRRVLELIGASESLAIQIAHATFSDVRIDTNERSHGATTVAHAAPRQLTFPECVDGEWAVRMTVTSPADLSRVRHWSEYLDEQHLPSWLSGARGARVSTDPQSVASTVSMVVANRPEPITVAVRQGRLTLLIVCPAPTGQRYLHEHAYAALDAFRFRFDRLRTHDARPPWWQWAMRRIAPMPTVVAEART